MTKTIGKYEVLEEVGRGGMGVVYKGMQPSLNRVVAIKILLDQFATNEEICERFVREARAAATLEHPNIVTIYDVGKEEDTYYCAMQFLDAKTVIELVREKERLPLDQAVAIAAQVADGLQCAQDKGIIHRDIKPGNILVDSHGRVTITDFGIARVLGESSLTLTGTTIGSPGYMAPEQIQGKDYDHRVDIYSLGVVFYEMLTGFMPYTGDTPVALMYKHMNEPIPRVRDKVEDLPEEVDLVLERLMAKTPEERFSSAKEVRAALTELGAPTPMQSIDTGGGGRSVPSSAFKAVKTVITGVTSRVVEKTGGNKFLAAALGVFALFIVLGGGWYLLQGASSGEMISRDSLEASLGKAGIDVESFSEEVTDKVQDETTDKDSPLHEQALFVSTELFDTEPSLLWSHSEKQHKEDRYPWIGLKFDSGMLFADTRDSLIVFDGKTGKRAWQKDQVERPTLVSDLAVVAEDGVIYGLDKETGAAKWRREVQGDYDIRIGNYDKPYLFASLYGLKSNGQRDYSKQYRAALFPKNGALLWKFELPRQWMRIQSHGSQYVTLYRDELLFVLDGPTGAMKWKHEFSGAAEPLLRVAGDLFVGVGWMGDKYRLRFRAGGRGYPAFDLSKGEAELWRLDPNTGQSIWKQPLPGAPAYLAKIEGNGYLATWGRWDYKKERWKEKSGVHSLDLDGGEILQSLTLIGFPSRLVSHGERLLVAVSPWPSDVALSDPDEYQVDDPVLSDREPKGWKYPKSTSKIVSVDKETMTIKWEASVGKGVVEDIWLSKSELIVRTKTALQCFHADTGAPLWRYELSASRARYRRGNTIIFASDNKYVNAVDATSGKMLWRKEVQGEIINFRMSDEEIFVATDDGEDLVLRVFGERG